METVSIIVMAVIAVSVSIFVHMIGVFVMKLIKQNNILLESADKRLSKANEMVLTLAHSADTLSESVKEMKDMMCHLEQIYTSRNDMIVRNRDEFREAYMKLLETYKELQTKYETMMCDSYHTVKELARRPSISNNNNNGTDKDT